MQTARHNAPLRVESLVSQVGERKGVGVVGEISEKVFYVEFIDVEERRPLRRGDERAASSLAII